MEIGDKVIVKGDIERIQDVDKLFIDKTATIKIMDDYVFPIELEFDDKDIQKIYKETGSRRFGENELIKK